MPLIVCAVHSAFLMSFNNCYANPQLYFQIQLVFIKIRWMHICKRVQSCLQVLTYVWVALCLIFLNLSPFFPKCPKFLVHISENVLIFLKTIMGTLAITDCADGLGNPSAAVVHVTWCVKIMHPACCLSSAVFSQGKWTIKSTPICLSFLRTASFWREQSDQAVLQPHLQKLQR